MAVTHMDHAKMSETFFLLLIEIPHLTILFWKYFVHLLIVDNNALLIIFSAANHQN